jgi:hypothetical protein
MEADREAARGRIGAASFRALSRRRKVGGAGAMTRALVMPEPGVYIKSAFRLKVMAALCDPEI